MLFPSRCDKDENEDTRVMGGEILTNITICAPRMRGCKRERCYSALTTQWRIIIACNQHTYYTTSVRKRVHVTRLRRSSV